MSFPNLPFWSNLLGTVGIEVCAVVALGVAAQCAFRRAYWKRAMWQMTLLCLILISASEWTGAGRGAVWSILGPKRAMSAGAPMTLSPNVEIRTLKGAYTISPPLPSQKKALWWPGWVWLAGIVVVLGRMATAQVLLLVLRFRREKIVDDILGEKVARVARTVGIRRKVCLLRLPESISPMAFGILFPTIGLPPGFETGFNAVEQDAILAHELAHLAVLDPLWFRLADFASALLWWHPLVWWARRSLHGASELAADEATALVADGPGSLANCLVGLGKKMTLGHGWGWVGINGEFRSKLGKRVERLTRMPGKLGRPFVSWTDTLTRIAVAILIVPSAILLLFAAFQTAHGERENGWRQSWDSSPGRLLVMAAHDTAVPDTAAVNTADKPTKEDKDMEVRVQVATAKYYYELGKFAEAKAVLKQVLKDDPSNQAASYYLRTIKDAELLDGLHKKGPTEIPLASNGGVDTSNYTLGRPNIISKLEHIHLEKVDFNSALTEVLANLRNESQQRDPEGFGINFLIESTPHPQNGSPSTYTHPPIADLGNVAVKFASPLHNGNLVDVLHVIVTGASQPIRYKIEDYGVVFSAKTPEDEILHSLRFNVDPRIFGQKLRSMSAMREESAAATPGTQSVPPESASDAALLTGIFRAFLAGIGVPLSKPTESLFYDDHQGILLVRATSEELQIIGQAVESLNQSPPQVTIESKFIELSQQDAKALGFEKFLTADDGNLNSIMSDAEYRAALKSIEQNTHSDILSAPKITTLSGRQAHVASQDLQTFAIGSTTTNVALGAVLDIIPTVSADGYFIKTTVIFSYTDFLRNDPPGAVIPAAQADARNKIAAPLPLPHFRVFQAALNCNILDGHTVVTGHLVSDNLSEPKRLHLFFVTPTIIDPAGNRVHSDEELSDKYRHNH